jgi:alpha-galactosidase
MLIAAQMEIGNGGLTLVQEQSHFSLWCLVKAPLIIGGNLLTISQEELEILMNTEVEMTIFFSLLCDRLTSHRNVRPSQSTRTRWASRVTSSCRIMAWKCGAVHQSLCITFYMQLLIIRTGPLSGGAAAVILFNRNTVAANITANWCESKSLHLMFCLSDSPRSDLGLSPSASMQVRDLWAHSNVGTFTGSYTATVQPYGVVFVKLTPA